jgi:anti-sigma factor RsiW
MHLTDHISDVQLNEYLDNETTERAAIETHLSSCDECTARLTALQTLFAEIESLPELELTHSFREASLCVAARFTPTPSLVPQLPRWLTLTATLQVVFAVIALILVAPFVTNLLPALPMPSAADIAHQFQAQWIAMLNIFSNIQFPTLPQLPAVEISSLVLVLTLAGVSLLWLVGNGLLLRRQIR